THLGHTEQGRGGAGTAENRWVSSWPVNQADSTSSRWGGGPEGGETRPPGASRGVGGQTSRASREEGREGQLVSASSTESGITRQDHVFRLFASAAAAAEMAAEPRGAGSRAR
ncbi:unnamed protein product, partial [Discosporangium mesarthrocarpum]